MRVFYESHSEFELPNEDRKIWRYCDLAKLISLLHRKALYLPCTTALQDAFEGFGTKPSRAEIDAREDGGRIVSVSEAFRKSVFINSWYLSEYESDECGAYTQQSKVVEGGPSLVES